MMLVSCYNTQPKVQTYITATTLQNARRTGTTVMRQHRCGASAKIHSKQPAGEPQQQPIANRDLER